MKKLLFLMLFINYISSSSDWRLVEQFDNITNYKYSDVKSIYCFDNFNCFALVHHAHPTDYDWRIYLSNDIGKTWALIYEAPNSYQQVKPKVLNVKKGVSPHPDYYFVLSDDNTIIQKSTDGAKTFKKIILDADDYYPDQFAMYDTSIGFLTNSNSIYTTKDGWETFEKHPKLHKNQTYYSTIFLDSNTVGMIYSSPWANSMGLGVSYIKYYLNEKKWDTVSYFGKEPDLWVDLMYSISFINDSLGFACGRRPDKSIPDGNYYDIIYKSINGGNSWELVHKDYVYPQIGFVNNISFADEQNGIAVGFYGKIAMTNDGGDTWVYEPHPNDMKNCRKMQVCWAGRTPIIGTWDAGIFRYEGDFFKFPDTTGVEDNLITNDELLITPNPAEDYIEINFERCPTSLRCRTSEKIVIYNVLGECVKNPTPTLPASREGARFDVSDLPSGVYFVRIGNNVKMFVRE
jgi:hypothetical protein